VAIIVDASVAIKWFFVENDSQKALRLLETDDVAAPDLLLMECRNAVLNKLRRGAASRAQAIQFERDLEAARLRIFPSAPLLPNAFQLALDLRKSIYDCIYLAAALDANLPLVTADERFSIAIANSSINANMVRLLSALP
jgi:predicted nucleic acid-binding protein